MKCDIVLAGVGGQGILTVAEILARTAAAAGLNIKQSEVHGMAQRGGAVVAHLRLSDGPVWSDLIPAGSADVLLALEPMEALRHVDRVSPTGMVVANRVPVENIPDYPPVEELWDELGQTAPRLVLVDATRLAEEAGSKRTGNVVLIGAASVVLPLPAEALRHTLRERFAPKGDAIVEANLRAFDLGLQAAGSLTGQ